ncbi:hypothetical protein HanIR_Chr12g0584511 [Helianthus annuus]|nr:hypothetical protein HanIR_Chr12g0584511 [Helianthus annuus]
MLRSFKVYAASHTRSCRTLGLRGSDLDTSLLPLWVGPLFYVVHFPNLMTYSQFKLLLNLRGLIGSKGHSNSYYLIGIES